MCIASKKYSVVTMTMAATAGSFVSNTHFPIAHCPISDVQCPNRIPSGEMQRLARAIFIKQKKNWIKNEEMKWIKLRDLFSVRFVSGSFSCYFAVVSSEAYKIGSNIFVVDSRPHIDFSLYFRQLRPEFHTKTNILESDYVQCKHNKGLTRSMCPEIF